MTTRLDPTPSNAFERHVQSGIGILLIGLVAWVGVTVTGNSNAISRFDERMIGFGVDVVEMKQEFKSASGNLVEIPHLKSEIASLKSALRQAQDRITNLSARLLSLEQDRDRAERVR